MVSCDTLIFYGPIAPSAYFGGAYADHSPCLIGPQKGIEKVIVC